MRFYHRLLVTFWLLLPVFAPTAQAAESQQATEAAAAEQVVALALDTARMSDWKGFAKHMHPEGLKNFRDAVLPLLETATRQDADNVSNLAAEAALEILGVKRAEALEPLLALGPEPFFAEVLAASERRAEERQLPVDADYRIIGTAFENKRLAHVVVEAHRALKGVDLSSVEVFTVRQLGGEWRIVTSTSLQGVMSIFKLLQIK